ncbi:MAG TPA: bifunctional DNA-binding transcriptional regulator/O6-methylguanine-DNA methyltransferase Ada [Acidisarcina sp.]|nr:bifunctional DNA-binding transcriptional regulator/O6-methylguanine-DNA methyltransferase Ada [Acidisarcina sp.]
MGVSSGVWEQAWKMVEARSAAAMFVYAVRTTGIYCRPSCPSRRPLKTSVRFFATSELAERAGYRACKRCRPSENHPQHQLLTAACEYLEEHMEETVKLEALGKLLSLSPFHAQRLFRQALGITPKQYQQARRMERFREQLLLKDSVTEAVYEAGFSSSSRVYEQATAQMGMTPTTYREGAKGMAIRFCIHDCTLGKILVAVTPVGICSIALGGLESELEEALRERFPRAELARDDAGLGNTVIQVLSQMSEHPLTLSLPLDIRATAFQTRVWQALQRIPRGETRSYAEVAREIGQPTAVRAVARACASNPVALAIPCHRVVGSDGKLTGYRWGVERKRKLLEAERSAAVLAHSRI